jgi:hypothetical protein
MNTQQEIKRNAQGIIINDLGYTYNQFGQNLLKQLNLNYRKLNGEAPNTTRKSTQRESGNRNQNATRI